MADDLEAIAVLRDRRKHPRVDHRFGVHFRPLTDSEAFEQHATGQCKGRS
jgi:hypothetical protein